METTGNEQKEMPFLARVVMREADPGLVGRMSFAGVLRFAIQQSGFDDRKTGLPVVQLYKRIRNPEAA